MTSSVSGKYKKASDLGRCIWRVWSCKVVRLRLGLPVRAVGLNERGAVRHDGAHHGPQLTPSITATDAASCWSSPTAVRSPGGPVRSASGAAGGPVTLVCTWSFLRLPATCGIARWPEPRTSSDLAVCGQTSLDLARPHERPTAHRRPRRPGLAAPRLGNERRDRPQHPLWPQDQEDTWQPSSRCTRTDLAASASA